MPVLVRNKAAGPTVFFDKATNIAVEWGPAGDPSAEDVQMVPDALLENINFIRVLSRGVLVVEDEDVQARVAEQVKAWQSKAVRSQEDAAGAIQMEANNDLIILPCVGPAERGTGECGADVPTRDKQKHDRPALCSKHIGLEGEYIVSDSEKLGTDGKPEGVKVWTRMPMGRRAQEQVSAV